MRTGTKIWAEFTTEEKQAMRAALATGDTGIVSIWANQQRIGHMRLTAPGTGTIALRDGEHTVDLTNNRPRVGGQE
jgi:hypothetical protein